MTTKKAAKKSTNQPTTDPVQDASAPKKAVKKKATKTSRGKTGRRNRNKGSEETIPTSLRLTPSGFLSLRVLEAESSEMNRGQIVSNAIEEKAGRLASQPPIHLAKTCKEDLLTLAGLIADQEQSCNVIFRKIIRAKIEPTLKAELTDELATEIQSIKKARRQICNLANIPITHDLINDVEIAIPVLIAELRASTNKATKASLYNVIRYLTLHKPIDPSATPKRPTK